ncbi:MAG: hypothetical protein ACFFCW_13025 [Candidatus Hodarchaeota archaeon]
MNQIEESTEANSEMSKGSKDVTEKLTNVLTHLHSKRVDTIVDEMIELRRKECDECQANKVLCILQPRCGPNRDFLDILIGIDFKDIPKFCYGQRLRETKRQLDLEEEISNGTKIFLSDYQKLNGLKRKKDVKLKDLEKINGFIAGTDLGRSLVVLINKDIVVVDVEAGTVTFNPWDFRLTRKNFESFIKLLIKRYDFLELHRLIEEYRGLWILEVKTRIAPTNVETFEEAIKHSHYLLAYELEEPDRIRLIAEIQLLRSMNASVLTSRQYEPTISLGELKDALEDIATVARNFHEIKAKPESNS